MVPGPPEGGHPHSLWHTWQGPSMYKCHYLLVEQSCLYSPVTLKHAAISSGKGDAKHSVVLMMLVWY